MTGEEPERPGRLRDCPPWCDTDHGRPLDPVHRGVAAEIHRGDRYTVIIFIESDPQASSPLVNMTAWDLVKETSAGLKMPPSGASELAAIMAALGLEDIAGYLLTAVDLLTEPRP